MHRPFLMALLVLSSSALAHSFWVEPATGGYKAFYGEPGDDAPESGDKLDPFNSLEAWDAEGATLMAKRKKDHFFIATSAQAISLRSLKVRVAPQIGPFESRVFAGYHLCGGPMKKSKFSEAQIFEVLKESEAGAKTTELCRKHGISSQTLYKWRSRYGGMSLSDLKRLKALESENSELKKLVAEITLENRVLRVVNAKKF